MKQNQNNNESKFSTPKLSRKTGAQNIDLIYFFSPSVDHVQPVQNITEVYRQKIIPNHTFRVTKLSRMHWISSQLIEIGREIPNPFIFTFSFYSSYFKQ